MTSPQPKLRSIPAVHVILKHPSLSNLTYAPEQITAAVRAVLDDMREVLRTSPQSTPPTQDEIVECAIAHLSSQYHFGPQRVINATGVILHTNLGRTPLPLSILERVAAVHAGYSNLEFDLHSGERGDRQDHIESLLCQLTGAEAAIVVNNNAAAVLLTLTAIAKDREVVVSRGELIEIGGSFRLPDVIASCGARLREVGTTNRTYVSDYHQAISAETGALMKMHTSNYQVVGFVHTVSSRELAELGAQSNIPTIEDLGSGALVDFSAYGMRREPTIQETIASGIDIVTVSGDKLLGGPQAGLILGRKDLIWRLKKHPLMRALRPDKLTLSLLGEVLHLYAAPERLLEELPLLRMLRQPMAALEATARHWLDHLTATCSPNANAQLLLSHSTIGGGSLPGDLIPTICLAIAPRDRSATELAQALRLAPHPVIGRIERDRLLLDPRTVLPGEEELVLSSLLSALAG